MKTTSWKFFTTLFTATFLVVLLISGTLIEQAFPQASVNYNQLVPIPPRTEINQGLTSPGNKYMTTALGLPSTKAAPIECTNTGIKPDFSVRENVGPFSPTGYKPAIEALKRIFAKVQQEIPDLYSQLGTAGMLCFRKVRGSSSLSNHSWGTAIDIKIDGQVGAYGPKVTTTQLGQLRLYPYFHAEKFYWGAGFSTNKDPMHFEASQELIAEWTSRSPAQAQFNLNESWTQNPYFGSRGTFFADVTGDGRADAIVVNNDRVTVRRSNGSSFTANESWTQNPYFGSRGTFFADVTGDGRADAIVVNNDRVTVRRSNP